MANFLAYSLCRLENLHTSMECCVFSSCTVYSAGVLSSHEHAVCLHGWNLLFLSDVLQHYESVLFEPSHLFEHPCSSWQGCWEHVGLTLVLSCSAAVAHRVPAQGEQLGGAAAPGRQGPSAQHQAPFFYSSRV